MTTLLNQALILTLVGMGMTFAALGLLVLGMYAMTALITDKPRGKEALEAAPETRGVDVALPVVEVAAEPPRDEARERAAVTAVALALAMEGVVTLPVADDRYRAAAAAVAMAVAGADGGAAQANVSGNPDAWNYHAREQQLTQGQRFARA